MIYGFRGDCGEPPTSGQLKLPKMKTGKLSVGQEGVRKSKRCNGMTPAVEIIFTATQPGRETVELQGDGISIRVKD